MFLADRLTVDRTWRTDEGFLGFSARFARTGTQDYLGREIDPDGIHKDEKGERRFKLDTLYAVDRPEDEVFDGAALGSFLAKPITDDHPSNAVTISNWADKARGGIGEVLRDGEFARMSGLITDATLIRKYEGGKRELSGGYQTELVIGDGINAKGHAYVAKQTRIRGNHVAVVDQGRAGSACAIQDGQRIAVCDSNPSAIQDYTQEKPVPKIMTIDGLSVDVSNADTAIATITTILAARDAALGKVTTLEAKTVTDAATIVAKDAEITKLTADLAAAKLTPQQMRDAGKAYALVCDKAKASGITVTDEMDEAAIMKAVVDKAMPGNTYTADHVAIAFEALTKDVKATDQKVVSFTPAIVGDAASERDKALNDSIAAENSAWRTPAKTAA